MNSSGEYHEYIGGCHEYIGGYHDSCGRVSLIKAFHFSIENPDVLNIPQCSHDIPHMIS